MNTLRSEQVHAAQLSNPLRPRNQLFTCLACQVAFPTADRQRAHYRTDWHKYNLKRKIAQLAPVTAEQFAQKVLAQQTKGREEAEKQGLVYECVLCKKSYFSENAFSNHLLSKKHKDLEFNATKQHGSTATESITKSATVVTHTKKEATLFSDTEEEITDTDSVASYMSVDHHPVSQVRCLFCNINNGDFDTNLYHMNRVHGFFLPDVEYLENAPGLVLYLAEKIEDSICLYCNGRGKVWKSPQAVRKHMLDKGHCKMAYDESENPEDLLRYYNFGSMSVEDFEAATADIATNTNDELVLESGERLGHRRFMRYYRQNHARRLSNSTTADPSNPLAITNSEGETTVAAAAVVAEPRNRRERRHQNTLLITDGSNGSENLDLLSRLPAIVRQQHDQKQKTSKRYNLVSTSRARNQNPI
ncbi:C2H2 type zinc-finger-domain-containing protein [Mycotypha africana]|uniref:C2H2 type zinc-finger-domain-containing protein n=1 Tax=Mycotypha africana TaxID=64632 RepID=UPI002300AA65|nr:C2H2 type zinc-finger-domain-containing protein [Mycotypha africana]KAI8991498.1 C2H2 type zinc-finger-domain-containing protein [Mycotypha africana]